MSNYRVVYVAGGVDATVTGSIDAIKSAMRNRFSELATVEPVVSGETLTFTVRAGSKAQQYRVVYVAGGVDATVTGTIDAIKSAMRGRFSELATVEPVVNGETLTFTVRAGSKAG